MAIDPTISLQAQPTVQAHPMESAMLGLQMRAVAMQPQLIQQEIAASQQSVAASQASQANVEAQLPSLKAKAMQDTRDLSAAQLYGAHASEMVTPSVGNPDQTPAGTPFKDGSGKVSDGTAPAWNAPAAYALFQTAGLADKVPAVAQQFAQQAKEQQSLATDEQTYKSTIYNQGINAAAITGLSLGDPDPNAPGALLNNYNQHKQSAAQTLGFNVVNSQQGWPDLKSDQDVVNWQKNSVMAQFTEQQREQMALNARQTAVSENSYKVSLAQGIMGLGQLQQESTDKAAMQGQSYNAADAADFLSKNLYTRTPQGLWVAKSLNDPNSSKVMLANTGLSQWRSLNPNADPTSLTDAAMGPAFRQMGDRYGIQSNAANNVWHQAQGVLPAGAAPAAPAPAAPLTKAPAAPKTVNLSNGTKTLKNVPAGGAEQRLLEASGYKVM
jgi:hypothetical protein